MSEEHICNLCWDKAEWMLAVLPRNPESGEWAEFEQDGLMNHVCIRHFLDLSVTVQAWADANRERERD